MLGTRQSLDITLEPSLPAGGTAPESSQPSVGWNRGDPLRRELQKGVEARRKAVHFPTKGVRLRRLGVKMSAEGVKSHRKADPFQAKGVRVRRIGGKMSA